MGQLILLGRKPVLVQGQSVICGDHVWDKLGSDNHCVHLG